MRLSAEALDLVLTQPFHIARGVQREARNVLARIEHDGLVGIGEGAPKALYGETPAGALAALALFADELGDDPGAIEDILARLERALHGNAAAKTAVDTALYDLLGRRLGVPLFRLWGLSAARPLATSYTITIDTPDAMATSARAAGAIYPILKIKLGTPHDVAMVRAVREVTDATLRVDANAAWTAKEAIATINALAPFKVELVEQPVARGDLEGLRLVREHVDVPIIADESCETLEDVARLAGRVDGINIKLMKCGGLHQALKMIHAARAHQMRVMIGCMIESSVAITAAAHLTPLADYADLDGALLLAHDPYEGVTFEHGRIILPDQPGLGIRLRGDAPFESGREIRHASTSPRPPRHAPPVLDVHGRAPARLYRQSSPNQEARSMDLNYDDALALLREKNATESLVKHGLAVSAAVRAYAHKYGEDELKWAITGLLHDVDYEQHPTIEEHGKVGAAWLDQRGYPPDVTHAVLAHNDFHGVARDALLDKVVFACDELTGLITAAALVRPNKSILGLEASSVRKKMKDKAFARGVNRDDIVTGAEQLGVDLNEHITFVIAAMVGEADALGLRGSDPPAS